MKHERLDGLNSTRLWTVREPDLDERLLSATVLEQDGGNLWVSQFMDKFDAMNPTAGAQAARKAAAVRERFLARSAGRALKRAGHTKRTRTIMTRERLAPLPAFHVVEAFASAGGALFAIGVSNVVLANYVVKSGSELYASDPTGAHLFAVLPLLGTLGVTAFERFLPSDTAKDRYATVIKSVGVVTFVIWAVAAAVTFAPDTSATAWLATEGNSPWMGIALILSHILGDPAWGYVLFRSAEHLLLGNRKRVTLPNPEYAEAAEEASETQAAHAACLREIGDIDDYLATVAKVRSQLQARAELEVDRVTKLWSDMQAAQAAYARAQFLNPK